MPRFIEREIEEALASVRTHIAQLEAEDKILREKLAIIQKNAEH
jgi:hypothetical protein